jgi:CrcB protein
VSAPVWIGIALLGGVGATARFAVDLGVTLRAKGSFPLGTMVVNLTGSLVIGVLAGAITDGDGLRLATTGFLGGYTTFSTWMFQTERLGADGEPRAALANIVVSAALGLGAVWLGMRIGEAL